MVVGRRMSKESATATVVRWSMVPARTAPHAGVVAAGGWVPEKTGQEAGRWMTAKDQHMRVSVPSYPGDSLRWGD